MYQNFSGYPGSQPAYPPEDAFNPLARALQGGADPAEAMLRRRAMQGAAQQGGYFVPQTTSMRIANVDWGGSGDPVQDAIYGRQPRVSLAEPDQFAHLVQAGAQDTAALTDARNQSRFGPTQALGQYLQGQGNMLQGQAQQAHAAMQADPEYQKRALIIAAMQAGIPIPGAEDYLDQFVGGAGGTGGSNPINQLNPRARPTLAGELAAPNPAAALASWRDRGIVGNPAAEAAALRDKYGDRANYESSRSYADTTNRRPGFSPGGLADRAAYAWDRITGTAQRKEQEAMKLRELLQGQQMMPAEPPGANGGPMGFDPTFGLGDWLFNRQAPGR